MRRLSEVIAEQPVVVSVLGSIVGYLIAIALIVLLSRCSA